jgi:tRNA pseudouridine38-40 synthase
MRYKLTVEYCGTNYCGFQKQPNFIQKSVEEVLGEAVFQMTKERVKIIASGRTDAGVHALAQVIHFDLNKKFEPRRIVMGLNNYLQKEEVAILKCELADENFHARFSAKARHYRYQIINRTSPLTLEKNRAWHLGQKLDIERMREAAEFLIGTHDFSSFRDKKCQAKSPITTIQKILVTQNNEKLFIEISAKSFLHHMVRNIVGTLVLIGSGKIPTGEIQRTLEAKTRTKSGPNAPACGLYFLQVDY